MPAMTLESTGTVQVPRSDTYTSHAGAVGIAISRASDADWRAVMTDMSFDFRALSSIVDAPRVELRDVRMDYCASAFCEERGLWPTLTLALRLARKHFAVVDPISICWDHDESDNDEYILVKLRSSGGADTDFGSYFNYIEEWSETVPYSMAQFIRLDFDPAS
jgi:hypothetical protein